MKFWRWKRKARPPKWCPPKWYSAEYADDGCCRVLDPRDGRIHAKRYGWPFALCYCANPEGVYLDLPALDDVLEPCALTTEPTCRVCKDRLREDKEKPVNEMRLDELVEAAPWPEPDGSHLKHPAARQLTGFAEWLVRQDPDRQGGVSR